MTSRQENRLRPEPTIAVCALRPLASGLRALGHHHRHGFALARMGETSWILAESETYRYVKRS
ncbi:MAG: hypothetical protein E6J87_04745 [Deltaproteobacteria bacterium]|nr:MAG: hypothetical protein E6J87_04745 [Deltaproteobacteria bacterium]